MEASSNHDLLRTLSAKFPHIGYPLLLNTELGKHRPNFWYPELSLTNSNSTPVFSTSSHNNPSHNEERFTNERPDYSSFAALLVNGQPLPSSLPPPHWSSLKSQRVGEQNACNSSSEYLSNDSPMSDDHHSPPLQRDSGRGSSTGNSCSPRSTPSSPDSGSHHSPSPSTGAKPFGLPSSPSDSKKRKGVPHYIPSYMDVSNGPEPCVVCGDAATGYHYRCMTCEGCKVFFWEREPKPEFTLYPGRGFFRRTIQKNLSYHCKNNGDCVVDKITRNQCQQCRFRKCIAVGMATDLVLNEKQRVAKRKLIDENRIKRRMEAKAGTEILFDEDKKLIQSIAEAYASNNLIPKQSQLTGSSLIFQSRDSNNLAQSMTPSVVKVIEFAKQVPGFLNLDIDDQILLLKLSCMEILCLRAACLYDQNSEALTLPSGLAVTRNEIDLYNTMGFPLEPIFDFATGLSKLALDETELALLASVLLIQSDRGGLKNADAVEKLQDQILGVFKRYVAENRPKQPVHWAKILMKVTDIRTLSTRYSERVLSMNIDNATNSIPPAIVDLFGDFSSCYASSESKNCNRSDSDKQQCHIIIPSGN